jgi:hypothetical protein
MMEAEARVAKQQAEFVAYSFHMTPVIHQIQGLSTELCDQTVYNFIHYHHIQLSLPSLVTTPRDEAATASNIGGPISRSSHIPSVPPATPRPIPCFLNPYPLTLHFFIPKAE